MVTAERQRIENLIQKAMDQHLEVDEPVPAAELIAIAQVYATLEVADEIDYHRRAVLSQ